MELTNVEINISSKEDVKIPYRSTNADEVIYTLGKTTRSLSKSGSLLLTKSDFYNGVGNYTIYLQPVSKSGGSGDTVRINVNVINETNGKFSVSIHSNRCIITDEHLDKSDITVGFVNTDTLTEMFLEGGNPISLVMGGRMTFNGDMAKGKELKGLFVE